MSEGGTSNGVQSEESAEMSAYKKEACKVVSFKLVYDKDDLDSENTIKFKPEMSHQVFGERYLDNYVVVPSMLVTPSLVFGESIFGYRSLSITLNYTHNSCQCYVDLETAGKIRSENMKADDIVKSLNSWLPSNFTRSLADFSDWLDNEEHDKMFGEVIGTFEDSKEMVRFADDHIKPTYRITQNDVSDESFRDFHARFETFIVWFIDAANFIDLEDDRWLIYYVYEELVHPLKKTVYRSPVGFCSVYKFFAFPSNLRARISQFFILPSHQKRGIGTKLYETVAKSLRAMDKIVDITVEEPTKSFQKIRDLDDCLLMYKELLNTKTNLFTTSSKVIFEKAKHMKICRRQAQRVYDILGLYYASEKGPAHYKKFLEHIKSRIFEEKERDSKPGKRFCNLQRAVISVSIDKKPQAEAEYKRHVDDVEHSLNYLQSKLKSRLESDS